MDLYRRVTKNGVWLGWIAGALLLQLGAQLKADPVSLGDCVTAAQKNSLAVASLEVKVRAAGAAVEKDRRGVWPALTLSDQGDYSAYKPEANFTDGPENMANAELAMDLQQWIAPPDGLSQVEMRRAQLLLSQARAQVVLDVSAAYNRVMVLRRQAAERQQAVAYVTAHLKDIQRLQALGMDVELDLLRAGSQRKMLDLSALGQDAELQNSLATLSSLTGLSLRPENFVPDQVWVDSVTNDPGSGDAALMRKAGETLQAQLDGLDLETARLATRGTGPIAAPLLKVGVNHAFKAIDPATPIDQTYASLTLNAFDWGQRSWEGRQRSWELAAQESAGQEQARQLRLQAGKLAVDMETARKAYAVSGELLVDAQKGMEISEKYYRQGKIKETDLLSVFSDFLAAQGQQDQALQDLLQRRAEWGALWAGVRP